MPANAPRPLILILENDGHLADALALLMHDWGFAAVPARSARAAARELGPRIKEVCAIVADYYLEEGFTGIRDASAIANAAGRAIPTILTTGHSILAEHQDVFPVLRKPFDPCVLQRWLEDHVGRSRTAVVA